MYRLDCFPTELSNVSYKLFIFKIFTYISKSQIIIYYNMICITGEVTALSVETMLDVENCCCLTPTGHLVLSLQRNCFLELGIEQGPAVSIKKTDNRYCK